MLARTLFFALAALACEYAPRANSTDPHHPAKFALNGPQENQLSTAAPQKLKLENLPNPIRVHPKLISGGLPEGEKAFAELKSLGIKTVISVDGAKPDIETAKRYGLRYVHLPHGYDGILESRVKELAKAVFELDGPIYIHCHHGKHRSPVAASVACVAAGLIPPQNALPILEIAGTSPSYKGLYQAAKRAKPLTSAELKSIRVEYHETSNIPPLAELMVALDHTHDHLKSIATAKWKSPANHPDLDPAHEALLLREYFKEMLRSDATAKEPEPFKEMLRESETAAAELEHVLQLTGDVGTKAVRANAAFEKINSSCTACHKQFRDVPLNERK